MPILKITGRQGNKAETGGVVAEALDPTCHVHVHSPYPADLDWCSSPVCRLWVTRLIKHPRFSYCAPLAPALGSALSSARPVHNPGTRRLSELLLTIGGARACGYGVAHKGNTGCGIETVLIAARSKVKNAHPDW